MAVLALGAVAAPGYADGTDPDPAVTNTTPTATTGATDATDAAVDALDALDDVEELLSPAPADDRSTESPVPERTTDDGRDLTLALRDLRLRQADLPSGERARAAALLSRPPTSEGWADEVWSDFGSVRVHWDNGTVSPDYINQVGAIATHVLDTYQTAGYRAPKSDGTVGGDAKLDVYITDLGVGLYGYCNTDHAPPSKGPYDTPAYCTFSSDYSWAGGQTALDNLRVTAAHELFHATQFAYDYEEDAWFMEATATWAEDEVYDDIDDNRQYLSQSPMRQPRKPLDQFLSCYSCAPRQYGEWIFFRYLTERFPQAQGGLPVIMRRLWQRVDASSGGPDNYSIQAVARELASRKTDLRHVYAQFGDANRRPSRTYEEGRFYRAAGAAKSWTFTPRKHSTPWQRLLIDHLSTGTVQVKPSAALRGKRLRIDLALPRPKTGAAAVVTRYDKSGRSKATFVRLSKAGNARVVVPFSGRTTTRVDVTLSNAGIRYRCWTAQADDPVHYSCSGRPKDNNAPMRYRLSTIG
ncbi:hypothetical protein ASC77_10005 [Nocardioides sp. Root1257]|nr:hypothetical protein ASC77_10005 [Nocardioides sp. Root1257]KRC48204.1 hypothetical protein ASE24_10010 [Nocardioides sp. Root224]